RPKTIRPDSLAKAGNAAANVEGIKGMKSLTDGERTVELLEVPNPHSAGMLVAYLLKEKMVFVSDLFTPGTPVEPSNKNGIDNAAPLYGAMTAAKLDVARIVGGHGETAPVADLAKVAAMKSGS